MASKYPPVNGEEFTFRVVLFAQSDNQIKTTPTIAAGDFTISTDGNAVTNLDTIPAEDPASSGILLVTVSIAETTGDEFVVRAIDAADAEWNSAAWTWHTVAAGQQMDDLSTLTTAQVNTEVDNAFTTQMADSVPADGTIPTREQSMYMTGQYLIERAVSGTTVTIYKVDGSTPLFTITLDDGVSPTTATRAT